MAWVAATSATRAEGLGSVTVGRGPWREALRLMLQRYSVAVRAGAFEPSKPWKVEPRVRSRHAVPCGGPLVPKPRPDRSARKTPETFMSPIFLPCLTVHCLLSRKFQSVDGVFSTNSRSWEGIKHVAILLFVFIISTPIGRTAIFFCPPPPCHRDWRPTSTSWRGASSSISQASSASSSPRWCVPVCGVVNRLYPSLAQAPPLCTHRGGCLWLSHVSKGVLAGGGGSSTERPVGPSTHSLKSPLIQIQLVHCHISFNQKRPTAISRNSCEPQKIRV